MIQTKIFIGNRFNTADNHFNAWIRSYSNIIESIEEIKYKVFKTNNNRESDQHSIFVIYTTKK